MPVSEQDIDEWGTWLRAAGRSKSTIDLRTYHLRRVMDDLRLGPWAVTTEDLVRYLASQEWAAETRRSYRASLRQFYEWGVASGRCEESPATPLPQIKPPRRLPNPTPEAHYRDALLEAPEREHLMIRLGGICGLRRGEIAKVRREHVEPDLDGWSLMVIGKGGHERHVPLPDDLAREIREMPAGYLFPSPYGGHLTPAHVGKLISGHLPEGWATHSLRHRCGTVAYNDGGKDVRAVQELLGHARLETTQLYTKVSVWAIRDAIRATAS